MFRYHLPPNIKFQAITITYITLMVLGCAGAPEIKETREISLNKALLVRDVTNRQTDSIPDEEASVFSPEDPQALMWVKLDDVAGRKN